MALLSTGAAARVRAADSTQQHTGTFIMTMQREDWQWQWSISLLGMRIDLAGRAQGCVPCVCSFSLPHTLALRFPNPPRCLRSRGSRSFFGMRRMALQEKDYTPYSAAVLVLGEGRPQQQQQGPCQLQVSNPNPGPTETALATEFQLVPWTEASTTPTTPFERPRPVHIRSLCLSLTLTVIPSW